MEIPQDERQELSSFHTGRDSRKTRWPPWEQSDKASFLNQCQNLGRNCACLTAYCVPMPWRKDRGEANTLAMLFLKTKGQPILREAKGTPTSVLKSRNATIRESNCLQKDFKNSDNFLKL